jgi:2-polyprenyl-3-methyl-5-hydroxy-6-metoxy-1,4-benzoquinol methylase
MDLKEKMKSFFDRQASDWDKAETFNARQLNRFLSELDVIKNERVLDIGCGTGIIDGFLLDLGAEVTAIDIAPKMIEQAQKKYQDSHLRLLCMDFFDFKEKGYDVAVLFNSYPHFVERERLVSALESALKPGGRFIILHSASKEKINEAHQCSSSCAEISSELLSASEEAAHFAPAFSIVRLIDTSSFYLIEGIKKEKADANQ